VPECQKIEKGGLNQYGAECFRGLIFATIRRSVGTKALEDGTYVVCVDCICLADVCGLPSVSSTEYVLLIRMTDDADHNSTMLF